MVRADHQQNILALGAQRVDRRLGDQVAKKRDRTAGVVVAGHRKCDADRIAIGIDHCGNRDVEALGKFRVVAHDELLEAGRQLVQVVDKGHADADRDPRLHPEPTSPVTITDRCRSRSGPEMRC